ncbi:MAG: ABC transporter ATP-binding protein [Theionarchaea archaeon]|nr:MAG: ABC transporter ATP-binding protein [Theionarchaea archaeon DG-70]MBU7010773.1 ABC transporter ATP-binding protein [Theionarchaea archaeon]
MEILEIKNLGIILGGKKILNNISMNFQEGKVHAIVGPNGAGKSTIAFAIMGLEGYTDIQGDILFEKESITELDIDERARKGITLAWQEPARYEGLTVEQFIRAAARDKSTDTIKHALSKVGLDPEYMVRAVDKTLSGGERKKIEVASILVMEPKLVLLDEPDSGIDIESIEKIFDIIKVLKEKGTTVILITHSMAVLQQAEQAFLMCNGEIVDRGVTGKICTYFEKKCIPCNHKNLPDVQVST